MANKSPLDPDGYPFEYDYGIGGILEEVFVLAPEERCCMYPCSGTDCLCLCNAGSSLAGHAAARSVAIVLDFAIAVLSMFAGAWINTTSNCAQITALGCDMDVKFKNPAIVMCYLAAIAAIAAFCTSCAFLASLSWLYGARLNRKQTPGAASKKMLFLFNRKDTNLDILLFSFHAVTCLFSILAAGFGLKYNDSVYRNSDPVIMGLLITSLVLSCVLVILQPMKFIVGQTLCVKM